MNNQLDLVSVIIPVYNVEEYIEKCIDSVLRQDYKNIEVICVDDGSDDSTVNIIMNYVNKNRRVKLYKQDHKNAGAARNLGLRFAKGKYVHFLDGDDWLKGHSVYSKLVKILNETNTEMCMFSFAEYNNNTKIIHEANLFNDLNDSSININISYSVLCKNNNVIPWNKLYRKDFLDQIGAKFDEIFCANDRSFYYQTIVNANAISYVKDSMIYYRVGNKSSLAGGGRKKHFDCHIYTSKRIMEIVNDCSIDIQWAALNANLSDLFNWYPKIGQPAKLSNKKAVVDFLVFLERKYQISKNCKSNWWYPWYKVMLCQNDVKFDTNIISVVYFVDKTNLSDIKASIQSLCDHINNKYFYDIYVFTNIIEDIDNYLEKKLSPNYRISCINIISSRNISELAVYAAEYLSCYENCICLCPNTIINHDISELYNEYSKYAVCAVLSTCNKFYDTGVILFNTELFVENNGRDHVLNFLKMDSKLSFGEAFSNGVAEFIQELPQFWDMQVDCSKKDSLGNQISNPYVINFTNSYKMIADKSFSFSDLYFKYHKDSDITSNTINYDVMEKIFVRSGADVSCFSRVWKSEMQPKVQNILKGIILPARKVANTSYYEGGVCDSDFKFISGLARKDYHKPEWGDVVQSYLVDRSNLKYIDECVVFGGVFIGHFGHMIRDNLSRLWWCVKNSSSNLKIACIISFGKVEEYFYEFFDLLNIDRARIIFISQPTMFKEIIVPEEAVHSNSYYMEEWLIVYDEIVKNTIAKYKDKKYPNKIYISKSQYKLSGKITFNEEYFERFYRDKGYEIIYPEKLTVEENISYICNADDIAATVGTTSTLSIFAKPGTRIELLGRVDNYIYETQCLINEAKRLDWYYIDTSMNFMPCNFFSSRILFVGVSPQWKEYVSLRWGSWLDEYNMDQNVCWNYFVKWLQIYSEKSSSFVNERIDTLGVNGIMQRMCNIILDKHIDEAKFVSGEPLKITQILNKSEKVADHILKTQSNILSRMKKI